MADIMSEADSTELPTPLQKEEETAEVVKEEVSAPAVNVEPTNEIVQGMVANWKKTHGFLEFSQNEKNQRIFVHESDVISDDKKVFLRRGMECQFKIIKGDDDRLRATEVSARDGAPLNFHMKHGESDKYDREIQFDGEVFTGVVKFFSRFRGYGRISVNEAGLERLQTMDADMEACADLYFKENDLEIAAYPAKINRNDIVTFNIFNSSRGWGAQCIKTEDGELIPQFTEEDRAAKKALQQEETENVQEEKPKKERRRRQRRERKTKEVEEVDVESFTDVVADARYEGTVSAFNVHRFGFIVPADVEVLRQYGIVKNDRLSFRAFDVDTDARPAMIDNDAKVTFSLERHPKTGVLYAMNIRNENNEKIVSERKYEAAEPRELESEEWIEGTVFFYNWRRGHGRMIIDGEEEKFYFHRDDIRSNDKVPGIEDGMKVICQRCKDTKGPSVTNIKNVDGTDLEGQLPKYFKEQQE